VGPQNGDNSNGEWYDDDDNDDHDDDDDHDDHDDHHSHDHDGCDDDAMMTIVTKIMR
jgi:hypothetical protein